MSFCGVPNTVLGIRGTVSEWDGYSFYSDGACILTGVGQWASKQVNKQDKLKY